MSRLLFVINEADFVDNLGIASLSAVARQHGWTPNIMVFDKARSFDAIRQFKPDVIAYSVMSPESPRYIEISALLRANFSFVSIMGGPHPTYFPDVVQTPSIDYICRGEGELAFGDFLDGVANQGDISAIPNIGGKTFMNPVRPLVADLDSLPVPERPLFYDSTGMADAPIKAFMASRGCPFSCSYCFNDAFKQLYAGERRYVRTHSVPRFISEIEAVKSAYPVDFIKMEDDVFGVDLSWLRQFAVEYKQRVGIPFNCFQRVDVLTDKRIGLLKDAGCVSIMVAIDSANPRIRNEVLGRSMKSDNADIRERIRLIKKHGLGVMTSTIIGTPTSTMQDELDSLELNISSGADYAAAPVFYPYMGTSVWQRCKDQNWLPAVVPEGVSLQQRSILTCFSEDYKDWQWRLSAFYPFIVKCPILKKPLLWAVSKSRSARLAAVCNFMVKSFLMGRYIYPFRSSWRSKVKMLLKAFPMEWKRMLAPASPGGSN